MEEKIEINYGAQVRLKRLEVSIIFVEMSPKSSIIIVQETLE
jgi:hypothetical protein